MIRVNWDEIKQKNIAGQRAAQKLMSEGITHVRYLGWIYILPDVDDYSGGPKHELIRSVDREKGVNYRTFCRYRKAELKQMEKEAAAAAGAKK